MKDIRIIFENDEGGVAVMARAHHTVSLEFLIAQIPEGKPYKIIELSELPTDYSFRRAWKFTDLLGVHVDMVRARDLHRNRLRKARAENLAKLDALYMKADEKGDNGQKKKIADLKTRLRDITKHPAIEAAQTPDQLKQAALTDLHIDFSLLGEP